MPETRPPPPRTYVSPGREAAAAAKRQRVVATASRLLREEENLAAVSLDSIARAAGVTRLTVYNQFGSRRGLLEAVFDDRARQGGLGRIPQAMSMADAGSGLARLVEIFCDFWSFDPAVGRLHAAASGDPGFAEAVSARNERRRLAIGVLVKRMLAAGTVRPGAAHDLTDLLFALTGFAMFDALRSADRDPRAICAMIQGACASAVAAAGTPATPRRRAKTAAR